MPLRRINFGFGLGLLWTHGGRMALGLSVLLLVSLAAPGITNALQFDIYSLSAI